MDRKNASGRFFVNLNDWTCAVRDGVALVIMPFVYGSEFLHTFVQIAHQGDSLRIHILDYVCNFQVMESGCTLSVDWHRCTGLL